MSKESKSPGKGPADPGPIAAMIGYLIAEDGKEVEKQPRSIILIAVQQDHQMQRIYYGDPGVVLTALELTKQLHLIEMIQKGSGPKDPNKHFQN